MARQRYLKYVSWDCLPQTQHPVKALKSQGSRCNVNGLTWPAHVTNSLLVKGTNVAALNVIVAASYGIYAYIPGL